MSEDIGVMRPDDDEPVMVARWDGKRDGTVFYGTPFANVDEAKAYLDHKKSKARGHIDWENDTTIRIVTLPEAKRIRAAEEAADLAG